MACKRIKTLVSGIALATMTALAAPAFGAGDILDTVGQPGAANPSSVEPAATEARTTPVAKPHVVTRAHAHQDRTMTTAHKSTKRHHTVAAAKRPKLKKAKHKRHATAKRHAHKARGA